MAEGVGFEPTVRLPVRLISSQVPSTNSATLPLLRNKGGEDSVNRLVVDDLVTGSRSKQSAALCLPANRPSPSPGLAFLARDSRNYRKACTLPVGGDRQILDSSHRTIARP